LVTTTITIFGAAYELRPGAKTSPFVNPTQIFVGASVLYVFLSGYYYYMLAQFYACVITLISFVKSLGAKINPLWRTLRIPSFGVIPERITNIAMLADAPLLPIAFSTLSLIALRFVIEGRGAQNIGVVPTTIGISLQVLTCILVITQPFRSFIKATAEVSDESQKGSAPSASEAILPRQVPDRHPSVLIPEACHIRARPGGKLRSPAVTHGHRERPPTWARAG